MPSIHSKDASSSTAPVLVETGCQVSGVGFLLPGFGTKGRLSDMAKGVIYGLRFAGYSQRTTAECAAVHQATVRKAVADVAEVMEVPLPTVPPQRAQTPEPHIPEEPPTVAKRRDEVLDITEDLAKSERSVAKVRELLKERTGQAWSASTIKRDLKECGFDFKARPVTTCLKPHHMQRRLLLLPGLRRDFSRKCMIFTDECYFRAMDMSAKGEWVMDDEVPDPVRKYGYAAKVHVWGAICDRFHLLVVLSGSVNSEDYVDTLKRFLIPEMKKHGQLDDFVLMQDNASAHKAEATMNKLSEWGIATTQWPAYSPDLNPIENLWAIMKKRMDVDCFYKKEEVEKSILDVWWSIPDEMIGKLCASFPSRLDDCERVKGDDIKMTQKLVENP